MTTRKGGGFELNDRADRGTANPVVDRVDSLRDWGYGKPK